MIDFSIIIPHRNSLDTLPRLFATIPNSSNIEIIIVDNTPQPIRKEDIQVNRNYKLFYSNPERGAGGARNVGIEHAKGKWLIFADADDYFTNEAFVLFNSELNAAEDVIYFTMDGVYSETLEPSSRGDFYTNLVQDYLSGKIKEENIRYSFTSPCSKMVKKSLVEKKCIKFDEVLAGNDAYFSLLVGYYANNIKAINKATYVATVMKGSLTRRRDREVLKSRFLVTLRCNLFLKSKGKGNYQRSIMYYVYKSFFFGFKEFLYFIMQLFVYKQNPFVGINNWMKSYLLSLSIEKKEDKYIVKEIR